MKPDRTQKIEEPQQTPVESNPNGLEGLKRVYPELAKELIKAIETTRKSDLKIQVKLQNERVEVLKRIARDLKDYESTRQNAQDELLGHSVHEQDDPEGFVKRENTKLLVEEKQIETHTAGKDGTGGFNDYKA